VPRQIRLNLNLQTAGRHDAAWKRLGDTSELVTDVDYYVNIARLAERGKLDAIFLADSHGSLRGESTRRPWRGLDHVSHGRAAWNIITSQNPPTLEALGLQDAGHRGAGASDGFNVNIDVQTEGLDQFIDGVVAELQRRGRFGTEYEYETFRENLGVA
jgi:alkanesulfonate monooxygenase SsuD/methylene tetrahydromethanopterin reductase-like flavin-dependent oxidoreductase (luciferase family)